MRGIYASAARRLECCMVSMRSSLSGLANRMQKSSGFCSSSAKSTVVYTQAFSLPLCSCSFVPGMTAPSMHPVNQGQVQV